jgi:hypothetical protein
MKWVQPPSPQEHCHLGQVSSAVNAAGDRSDRRERFRLINGTEGLCQYADSGSATPLRVGKIVSVLNGIGSYRRNLVHS